jgi:hypothetical protein
MFKILISKTAPPTYSAPGAESYENTSPTKGPQPYQHYAHDASEAQELPAEVSPPVKHHYSELPAGSSNVMDTQRFSELPAEVRAEPASELESPQVSPRPLQAEFSNDMAKRVSGGQGLGVTGEASRKN